MFDSAFSGDLWSSGVFSFESPMKDLLDSGDFTLEQLLREDELLQEVKSMTPQLVSFFSQKETMSQLLQYIVSPPPSPVVEKNHFENEEKNNFENEEKTSTLGSKDTNDDEDEDEEKIQNEQSKSTNEEGKLNQQSANSTEDNSSLKEGEVVILVEHQPNEGSASTSTAKSLSIDHANEIPEKNSINADDTAATTRKPISSNTTSGGGSSETGDALDFSEHSISVHEISQQMAKDDEDEEEDDDQDQSGTGDEENEGEDDEDDDDIELRTLRFPYMACEVICMENSSIIDALVGRTYNRFMDHDLSPDSDVFRNNTAMLEKLFSVLDAPPMELDDRRAGYFEKILGVLLRIRAASIIEYINDCGMELFYKFVKHLGSNSIMLVVQRLMLAPPPSASTGGMGGGGGEFDDDDDDDDMDDGDDLEIVRCSWGENPDAVCALVDRLYEICLPDDSMTGDTSEHGEMTEEENEERSRSTSIYDDDTAMHISELLISLTQQASAESSYVFDVLTKCDTFCKIIECCSSAPAESEGKQKQPQKMGPEEGPMSSALALLEAILLQFCGFAQDGSSQGEGAGGHAHAISAFSSDNASSTKSQLGRQNSCGNVMSGLDRLVTTTEEGRGVSATLVSAFDSWIAFLTNDEVKRNNSRWQIPNHFVAETTTPSKDAEKAKESGILTTTIKQTQVMLGISRLRVVRVVEALVLLGHPVVDQLLMQHNQSSVSILSTCLDLFFDFSWCSMLHQSVANFVVHILESGPHRESLQTFVLVDLKLMERMLTYFSQGDDKDGPSSSLKAINQNHFRCGNMGHIIIMCQAVVHACNSIAPPAAPPALPASKDGGDNNAKDTSDDERKSNGISSSIATATSSSTFNEANRLDDDDVEMVKNEADDAMVKTSIAKVSKLAQAIDDLPFKSRWDTFIGTELVDITKTQNTTLGVAASADGGCSITSSLDGSGDDFGSGFGGGVGAIDGEALEISEGDLDVAVSMIEAMKVAARDDDDDDVEDNDDDDDIISGKGTSSASYRYEDPLGRKVMDDLGDDDMMEDETTSSNDEDDGDDASGDDGDAPVLDLFAGNFVEQQEGSALTVEEDFPVLRTGRTDFDHAIAACSKTSSIKSHKREEAMGSFATAFPTSEDLFANAEEISTGGSASFAAFDSVLPPSPSTSLFPDATAPPLEAAFDSNDHSDMVREDVKSKGGDDAFTMTTDPIGTSSSSTVDDPFGNTKVNIDDIL